MEKNRLFRLVRTAKKIAIHEIFLIEGKRFVSTKPVCLETENDGSKTKHLELLSDMFDMMKAQRESIIDSDIHTINWLEVSQQS